MQSRISCKNSSTCPAAASVGGQGCAAAGSSADRDGATESKKGLGMVAIRNPAGEEVLADCPASRGRPRPTTSKCGPTGGRSARRLPTTCEPRSVECDVEFNEWDRHQQRPDPEKFEKEQDHGNISHLPRRRNTQK